MTHQSMRVFYSFNFCMALVGVGTFITFLVPILMNWKMMELENVVSPPVLVALQSSEYHTSLVVSMSVSAPLFFELLLRILNAKLEFILPNAVMLTSLVVPDLIILCFIRVFFDLNVLNVLLKIRFILFMWIALTFIKKYGGGMWPPLSMITSFSLACVSRIMAFYKVYVNHDIHNIFVILGIISDTIAMAIFLCLMLRWYRYIFKERNRASLKSHQYMCTIYVSAALLTCIGLYVNTYSSINTLDWYQWNSNQLSFYSVLFTTFYFIVMILEGRVLQLEMLQTKVSSYL